MRSEIAKFTEQLTFLLIVVLAVVLAWLLFDVLLVVLGAVLVSVLLRLGAEPFHNYLKLPESVALILSGLLIVGVVGGTSYLFGTHIDAEMKDVLHRADLAEAHILTMLRASQFGRLMLSHAVGSGISVSTILESVFSISVRFIEAMLITIVAGIYLAAQPDVYRSGLIQLFPRRLRFRARETIDDVMNALRLWLLGQLIQMFLIGLLSTLAVWLIGLPSPLALGLIAAVTEFIPYLGPILASIPAILVATTQSGDAVIWTIVAYLLIHQIEGNLIVPLIQRRMVFIPPAVILLAIMAITFVFGPLAVIIATPVTVVIFVIIKKVYIRDTLGDETDIPGDQAQTDLATS